MLGDINGPGLEKVVSEIRRAGGYVLSTIGGGGLYLMLLNLSGKLSDCDAM